MKYKNGDIVKVIMIKRGVRWSKPERSEKYFKGKIGVVEYTTGKNRDYWDAEWGHMNKLFIIKFYFGKTDTKGIIKETFHIDELEKPSKKEMKKFQLLLEKINAKEVAEKL
jgi:ribosomal protein L21E